MHMVSRHVYMNLSNVLWIFWNRIYDFFFMIYFSSFYQYTISLNLTYKIFATDWIQTKFMQFSSHTTLRLRILTSLLFKMQHVQCIVLFTTLMYK